MDDKIVSIDDYRPHQASYCACVACGKDFVSVFPAGVTVLECPACGEMAGEVVRHDYADFFKRYIGASKTQADQLHRGYVLLNAKRMNKEG